MAEMFYDKDADLEIIKLQSLVMDPKDMLMH